MDKEGSYMIRMKEGKKKGREKRMKKVIKKETTGLGEKEGKGRREGGIINH